MNCRLASFLLVAAISAGLLGRADAAMRYPRVARDSQGTWIATDGALIHVVGDLWIFYGTNDGLPADRVRVAAPDDREVWAATPRGLGRMDRSSRRWEALRAPEPLPSNNVYSVAVDDRYAWVGTEKGAVRYDKTSREWSRLDDASGPGDRKIYDILSFGRSVWFATVRGVYRYDRQTQVFRHYGTQEGLDLGDVYEIVLASQSLWFLCRRGLARFDLRSEAISTFTEKDGLPSTQITAFAQVQGDIWIGTPKGMAVYSPGADAIGPFIYTQGMPTGTVTGIETALPWVWVSSDHGLGMFNTLRRVWEEKRSADGLANNVIEGIAMAGSTLVLLQPGGYQGYLIQQDDWVSYSRDDVWSGVMGTKREPSAWRFNFEMTLSGEGNFSKSGGGWENSTQLVPDLRLGMGTELEGGRTLDASIRLDAGDVTLPGIREYDAELRIKGNRTDTIRELLISDMMPLMGNENDHDLIADAWLEGLGIRQRLGDGTGRKRDPVEVEADVGLRRGVRQREFFRGSIDLSFQLSRQYITPGSDIVKVDGMILERGVDYIITHTTGQLSFLNPDRVNALSLIEVSYTYEQIPRKETSGRSLLEMLPWDNELGTFVRSGTPVYVTDEGGLYAQIDGAAPKYIDRGWVESVFLDYSQGSTKVSVQIHDMGSPEQAIEMFDYDRPVSYQVLFEDEDSIALLDESLPSGYAVKMRMDRFYVELTIDEKSRSSEILVNLFAQAIKTKGNLSGTLMDSLRPLVGRLRVGVNPNDHYGFGASYMGSGDLEDRALRKRLGLDLGRYDLASLDMWTNNDVGGGDYGGNLYSYLQLAKGHAQHGLTDNRGYAASGDLIYNAPAINLRLDGEVHSRDFTTLGTRDTPLGTFAGDIRGDATFMPLRWLSLRLLYDHQRSYLAPDLAVGSPADGVNESLLSKLIFMRAGWPTLWFLAGHSILTGGGHRDEKIRLAGSLEYDLAKGVLNFLGFRKLAVKGYFDNSSNEVSGSTFSDSEEFQVFGATPGTARNMRFELKAAPTRTEDCYARFERKTFDPAQNAIGGQQPLESWELVMGAASRYFEGLVPTFNGKLSRYKGSQLQGDAVTNVDTAQALLSGQVEMFPGRWIESLGSLMLAVGYGYTNTEEAENLSMQAHLQKHQFDGRAAYGNYDDPFRIETRGRFWSVTEDEHQDNTERFYEVLNRLTFRPIYTSPITLRFDVSRLEQTPIDTRRSGAILRYFPSLEWERRWSLDMVTKVRVETPLRLLDDALDENLGVNVTFKEWSLKPWVEARVRLRDIWRGSLMRFILRGSFAWIDWFESGTGAEQAWEAMGSVWLDWEKAGVFIVRLGVIYTRHKCRERVGTECASFHSIQPSIKAIARF